MVSFLYVYGETIINALFETFEFWFVTKFRTLQILLSSIHNYGNPHENVLKAWKN